MRIELILFAWKTIMLPLTPYTLILVTGLDSNQSIITYEIIKFHKFYPVLNLHFKEQLSYCLLLFNNFKVKWRRIRDSNSERKVLETCMLPLQQSN
jgi:hypothetical protein